MCTCLYYPSELLCLVISAIESTLCTLIVHEDLFGEHKPYVFCGFDLQISFLVFSHLQCSNTHSDCSILELVGVCYIIRTMTLSEVLSHVCTTLNLAQVEQNSTTSHNTNLLLIALTIWYHHDGYGCFVNRISNLGVVSIHVQLSQTLRLCHSWFLHSASSGSR